SRLSSETLGKIEKTYPSWLAVRNPIDMAPGASTGEVLGKTIKIVLEALLSDENVDGVVFIVVALRGQDAFVYSDIISQMAGRFRDKPIVSWFYGPDVDRDVAKKYDATGGTVVYPTCERAVRALAGLAQRYEFLVGAGHEGDKDVKPRGPGLTA
ncbi:MAG: hypothetical protein SV375_20050, partial [Thermodesulfobacteriota bacterium]|nr:hypothetical protein [Thermodesulfobacteriota bacterium]